MAAIAVLAPAWLQLGAYDRHDGAAIEAQRRADDTEGAELDRLVAVIERAGGGRTYAGMPSNWGQDFTVGAVPVFKNFENRDVDEVGYTLRTASLMTDPEYYFDDRDPSDYRLFGIGYLILPAGDQPPVRARRAMRSGPYCLRTIDGAGYVLADRIVGEISANRTNVGARSAGADAPSRSRGAQRLLRPRVDGNRQRPTPDDPDCGAGARRRRRPRGHMPRRVPLPRVRRLPGAARAERPHPRQVAVAPVCLRRARRRRASARARRGR